MRVERKEKIKIRGAFRPDESYLIIPNQKQIYLASITRK